jgi:predicted extracellular nuclease
VQEIASVHSFNSLLDSLPGWKGVLSDDTYGDGSYQKTGVLYKSSFISLSSVKNIFTSDGYAFPRPPLSAFVKIKDLDGTKLDFTIIVLHLKAMSGEENEARRRSACEKLKAYIDAEISAGADPDFVVLGDWNDILTDPDSLNVFQVFLDDTAGYKFLTHSISGRYSYISNSYRSLIDHIMITGSTKNYFQNGFTDVLYLDDEFLQYRSFVSDHRPVMARFEGFTLNLQPPAKAPHQP